MYFLGMKIDFKYMLLIFLSLNVSITSLSKFVNMTKNTAFSAVLHVFAPLENVNIKRIKTKLHAYIAWSWKNNPNYVFFLWGWYPTSNTSAVPHPLDKKAYTSRGLTNNDIIYNQSSMLNTIELDSWHNIQNWIAMNLYPHVPYFNRSNEHFLYSWSLSG